ncbi:MAG: hypothetical protein QOJ98_3584 [Acidobacteriota bacterium]|nr:hypothetical protein [Acidobacteriota bacterium]
MKRDTKIVLSAVAAIPALILGLSAICSWAISHGASMKWRLLFRTLCHGKPERCLELFHVPMPVCARCAAIYAGILGGLALFRLIPRLREKTMRVVAFAALAPLALDGLTQLAGLRESTNELRMATGVIAGLAFGLWILSAVERRDEALFTTP